MNREWQNMIPLKTTEQKRLETHSKGKDMIIEDDEKLKKNQDGKFHIRTKRLHTEMEKGHTASKESEILNKMRSEYSHPFKFQSKKIDSETYSKQMIPISSEVIKKENSEYNYYFACEALEKYLNMDERLVDLDKNINSSGIEQSKN